jgi:hypothetical protein
MHHGRRHQEGSGAFLRERASEHEAVMTMPVTVNEVLDGHAAPDLECLDRDMTRSARASAWPQHARKPSGNQRIARGADPGLPLAAGLLCGWLGLPTPSRRPVHLRVGVPSVLMEHALARLAVEPRLPVVVVLAVDDDATVFVMLNLIVAGWMTLVVLASKHDPRSAMRGWQTVR